MVLKTRALLVRQQTQTINALRAHLSELRIIAGIGTVKIASLISPIKTSRFGSKRSCQAFQRALRRAIPQRFR